MTAALLVVVIVRGSPPTPTPGDPSGECLIPRAKC
ncbi:unnamed protein product, partial [Allacma fusca]